MMIGNKPPKMVMIGMTMKVGVLIAPTYMHDTQVITRRAMLRSSYVLQTDLAHDMAVCRNMIYRRPAQRAASRQRSTEIQQHRQCTHHIGPHAGCIHKLHAQTEAPL